MMSSRTLSASCSAILVALAWVSGCNSNDCAAAGCDDSSVYDSVGGGTGWAPTGGRPPTGGSAGQHIVEESGGTTLTGGATSTGGTGGTSKGGSKGEPVHGRAGTANSAGGSAGDAGAPEGGAAPSAGGAAEGGSGSDSGGQAGA